ncbi:metallophosphoesterase family protein [Streptomyces sp. NPDC001401]|uniref:metallophosphoesterase family protein n=1 Tax=Streptomyces sp. NPDC001401 TaxID=3364570 RepID=UPI0036779116
MLSVGDRGTVTASAHTPGAPLRLVQISDTHLSRWDGPLRRNFTKLANYVNEVLRPDLIVHTGDVILSNPDADADYRAAVELLGQLSAPVRYLPGNHDVGEAYDDTWWGTTSERLARFRKYFGETPWLEWFGGVGLIGLDSQLLGNGLPEEHEQWRRLEDLAETVGTKSVMFFQHTSFWTGAMGSDGRPGCLAERDRERLLDIFGQARLLGTGNGDVHRYRKVWHDTAFELWGPSTAFLVHREEAAKLPAGLEQLGVVLYEFEHENVAATFQTTPGLEEVEVGAFPESRRVREEIRAAIRDFEAAV